MEQQKHVFQIGEADAEGNVVEKEVDILAMKNMEMIPILTKAIQEQQEIINDLKSQISDLQETNQSILSKLNEK